MNGNPIKGVILFILSCFCTAFVSAKNFNDEPKKNNRNSGTTTTVELIIIQGESNAGGRALNSAATAAELAPRSAVKILNNNNLTFESIDIGTNNNLGQNNNGNSATEHGLELSLTNEVVAGRFGTTPVYLVKIGESGSMIKQWLSGNSSGYWSDAITRIDAAKSYLQSQGFSFRITVWQSIGLNDWVEYDGNTSYPAQWKTDMKTFRSQFRSKYGANIPFVTTKFCPSFPWNNTIQQLSDEDSPVGRAVDISGATFNAGEDCTHWDYAGFKVIGPRMVTAMLSTWATNGSTSTANTSPTANAGADKTITLPTNSTSLAGSGTDPDGSVTAYLWTKVSGPAGGTITTPASASTTVTLLAQGVYQFQLQVTDNNGATATDVVQVTVSAAANTAPTANAGADKTITLPTNSVSLAGSGTDPDGSVTAYLWTKISGPATLTITTPSAASTTVTSLSQGVYVFQLKVTDNNGATATDNVQVTVNAAAGSANIAPAANAGNTQWVVAPNNSAVLTGAGTDPNGTIASYTWRKISGPAAGSISNTFAASTSLSGLVPGIYIWELKVTDNQGAIGMDSVYTIVNTSAGYPAVSTGKVIRVNIYNGTIPYNDAKWNNWKPSVGVNSSTFKFENGTASTVFASLSRQSRIVDNGSSYLPFSTICPTAALRYTSSYSGTRKLVVKGLDPAKKYAFEFYSSSAASGNQTTFAINGAGFTISTYNNVNAYASFVNIAPTSAGTIAVSISTTGSLNYLSAFAVIEQKAAITGKQTENARLINDKEENAEEKVTTNITAFPMPLTTSVTVSIYSEATGAYNLSLVDMSGKTVWKKAVNKSNALYTETIYMGNLSNGVYTLQVVSPDQQKTSRQLIKN